MAGQIRKAVKVKFTKIYPGEIYKPEAELIKAGMFQLTGTLQWNKELKWAQREVDRLKASGVNAEIGVLEATTGGKITCAIFRDHECEKRYKTVAN